MLLNTRRRALGLILAAGMGLRLPFIQSARGAENECFDFEAVRPVEGLGHR